MSVRPHTDFAPAERASWEQLHQQIAALNTNRALNGLLYSAGERILILNAHRQIIFVNAAAMDFLELGDSAEICGCRPGEILGCVHADQGEGGCGTSKDCRFCGAVKAVLLGLSGYPEVRKCEISLGDGVPPLDLILNTMPVNVAGATGCLAMFTLGKSASSKQIAQNTFAIQRYAALIEQG